MSKKKAHKEEVSEVTPEIAKAVEEASAVVENQEIQLNAELLQKIASLNVKENELDGMIIVGVKKGVFVPFVLAKNITDLITLDFVLKREVAKILDNVMNSQQK
jgi:hypothetical protein